MVNIEGLEKDFNPKKDSYLTKLWRFKKIDEIVNPTMRFNEENVRNHCATEAEFDDCMRERRENISKAAEEFPILKSELSLAKKQMENLLRTQLDQVLLEPNPNQILNFYKNSVFPAGNVQTGWLGTLFTPYLSDIPDAKKYEDGAYPIINKGTANYQEFDIENNLFLIVASMKNNDYKFKSASYLMSFKSDGTPECVQNKQRYIAALFATLEPKEFAHSLMAEFIKCQEVSCYQDIYEEAFTKTASYLQERLLNFKKTIPLEKRLEPLDRDCLEHLKSLGISEEIASQLISAGNKEISDIKSGRKSEFYTNPGPIQSESLPSDDLSNGGDAIIAATIEDQSEIEYISPTINEKSDQDLELAEAEHFIPEEKANESILVLKEIGIELTPDQMTKIEAYYAKVNSETVGQHFN